jgi:hypothetical protein
MPQVPSGAIVLRNDKNVGVEQSLIRGINEAIERGATTIINLDSDSIVKPDFISTLVDVHQRSGLIASGFNNPKVAHSKAHNRYLVKRSINGINMCFSVEQYKTIIEPSLRKKGNWDMNASAMGREFAITIPSCVQHIGMYSSMGHKGADVASDFKQLRLPDVTLFGIDSHDKSGIRRAAEISRRGIEFGAVKIITDDLFTKGGNTERRRQDYSKFMIKELTKHFNTSHVLTIHADGYVLYPTAWDNDWLEYDYIGATWWYKDGMNVGNGGFSLRSKKLCDILAQFDLEGGHYHPEDHHICRTYRPALERLGVKFAPAEVADKFSIEAYGVPKPNNAWCGQFGFHGVHVDLSVLSSDLHYKKGRI